MICPYCASDLSGASAGRAREALAPPIKDAIPQPVFRTARHMESPLLPTGMDGGQERMASLPAPHPHEEVTKRLLVTLLYFLLGSVFVLFALALLFLSDGETLTLRWNAALWPLFLVLALPLIGLGWRSWAELGEESAP
ncbi:MAG: hypothetical protein ACOYKZ_07695 [Chlamydiia bacterium]